MGSTSDPRKVTVTPAPIEGDPLAPTPLAGVLVGYGRVSTREQNLARQQAALTAVGCAKCFFDKASGKNADRPGLREAFEYLRPGDALTVVSLDRLGRSLVSGRDNPHRSSTGVAVSGHGWWDKGTCSNDRADAYNCLYEWYMDNTWRQKACSSTVRLAPGGGSANRTTARRDCGDTQLTSWRNHVDVDVVDEIDTSEQPGGYRPST